MFACFFGGGGGVQEVLLHTHQSCLREYVQVALNASTNLCAYIVAKCARGKLGFCCGEEEQISHPSVYSSGLHAEAQGLW